MYTLWKKKELRYREFVKSRGVGEGRGRFLVERRDNSPTRETNPWDTKSHRTKPCLIGGKPMEEQLHRQTEVDLTRGKQKERPKT